MTKRPIHQFHRCLVCVLACMLCAAAPAVRVQAQDDDADSNLPRLDRMRVIHVHERGTHLIQGQDHRVYIDREARIFNDPARERVMRMQMPIALPHLRHFDRSEVDAIEETMPLAGVDQRGRAWFSSYDSSSRPGHLIVAQIDAGVHRRWTVDRAYYAGPDVSSPHIGWPWRGNNLHVDRDGRAWLVTIDHLLELDERGTGTARKLPFPTPPNPNEASDMLGLGSNYPSLGHQVYRFGDATWVVRSMNSNCLVSGSFITRFEEGFGEITRRLEQQYINGLIHHEGKVYALVEMINPNNRNQFLPDRIVLITSPSGGEGALRLTAEQLQQTIAELDDDAWDRREAATLRLERLHINHYKQLQEALAAAKAVEIRTRLERVLQNIPRRNLEIETVKLADAPRARLHFIDHKGRQYLQPWDAEKPLAKLLVLDGKSITTIDLPSNDIAWTAPSRDGSVYGLSDKHVLVVSPDLKLRKIALMGEFTREQVSIIAAQDDRLCLSVIYPQQKMANTLALTIWLDMVQPEPIPTLSGNPIATDVMLHDNANEHYPIATAADGSLWIVRHTRRLFAGQRDHEAEARTQIMRARGDTVQTLSEPMASGYDPSIWALGVDTAIVPAKARQADDTTIMLWYHQGTTTSYPSLMALIEAQHATILEVMPDNAAFFTDSSHRECWLLRQGSSLYVEEHMHQRFANGSGIIHHTRIWHHGQWTQRYERPFGETRRATSTAQPILNRLMDIDADRGRVLAFQNSWQTLRWVQLSNEHGHEDIHTLERPWAWRWSNRTHAPRFAGSWGLTPEAAQRLHPIIDQRVEEARQRGSTMPEFDARYDSDDFAAFRQWDSRAGTWRVLDHSIYGSTIYQDAVDGVWQLSVRQARIDWPGGRVQHLPLDAGNVGTYRLVIESEDRVWVASLESLWRMTLVRDDAGQPLRWEPDRRLRLPRHGSSFAGPWITGPHLYYVSDQTLHHVPLAKLDAITMPADDAWRLPALPSLDE